MKKEANTMKKEAKKATEPVKARFPLLKVQYYSEMPAIRDWMDAPTNTFPMGHNKAEMERHAKARFRASGTKVRVVPVPPRELVAA